MATYTLRQSGGDYSTIGSALAAVSDGDTISIDQSWTIDDDSNSQFINEDDLTIEVTGDAKCNGVYDTSNNHYRWVHDDTDHVIEITGDNFTVDGLCICQNQTGSSDEIVRVNNSSTNTFRNCLFTASAKASDQDGIYFYHADAPTIVLENCVIYGFGRAGVNGQQYGTNTTGTISVSLNSCTLYDNGNTGENSGGNVVMFRSSVPVASCKTWTWKIKNCLLGDPVAGGTEGPHDIGIAIDSSGAYGTDYSTKMTCAVYDSVISQDCISDNTTHITDAGQNYESHTFADSDQGSGDYVILEDITTGNEDNDLRLQNLGNAKNQAQDSYATETSGSGLSLPLTDVAGISRPQNTNYDVGAHEISVGAEIEATAGSLSLSGSTCDLIVGRVVEATSGSLSLSGSTCELLVGRQIEATAGTLTLSGSTVSLVTQTAIEATSGTLTLSGATVALNVGHAIEATSATLSLSGATCDLLVGRQIEATSGSLSLAGSTASLLVSHSIESTSGTLTLAGSTVSLETDSDAAEIEVTSGTLTLTGSECSLLVSHSIEATSGSLSLTGSTVNLNVGMAIEATPGSLTLTGSNVSLLATVVIEATSAALSLSGSTVSLVTSATPTVAGLEARAGGGRLHARAGGGRLHARAGGE